MVADAVKGCKSQLSKGKGNLGFLGLKEKAWGKRRLSEFS